MDYVGSLALILIVTAVAGHLSVRMGLPAVIGQLLSGIILGPAVLGWVSATSFSYLRSQWRVRADCWDIHAVQSTGD